MPLGWDSSLGIAGFGNALPQVMASGLGAAVALHVQGSCGAAEGWRRLGTRGERCEGSGDTSARARQQRPQRGCSSWKSSSFPARLGPDVGIGTGRRAFAAAKLGAG